MSKIICICIFITAVIFILTSCQANDPTVDLSRVLNLPRHSPPEMPPRYRAEPVLDFIPSTSYGSVYPFIGQMNISTEHFFISRSYLIGFIDAQGRIICDPVYNDVQILSYKDQFVYVVTRKSFPQGIEHAPESFVSVISSDGAFYGRFDEVYISYSFMPFEHEYIAVRRGDRWGVIGFCGTQILPFNYINAPLFSEGLAAVLIPDSFDENTVALFTEMGELTVKGESLHISQLNVDTGELNVTGNIYGLMYSDEKEKQGGFFSRLFR